MEPKSIQFSCADFIEEKSINVMIHPTYNNLVTTSHWNGDTWPRLLFYRFHAIKGEYRLEISYAAADSRPVTNISLNGNIISRGTLGGTTGSWTKIRQDEVKVVNLKNGENTLTILSEKSIPHLQFICFEKTV